MTALNTKFHIFISWNYYECLRSAFGIINYCDVFIIIFILKILSCYCFFTKFQVYLPNTHTNTICKFYL